MRQSEVDIVENFRTKTVPKPCKRATRSETALVLAAASGKTTAVTPCKRTPIIILR